MDDLLPQNIFWDGRIIEIGGGYGGQCLTICKENPHCRYVIYDLPEVSALQLRFLSDHCVQPIIAHQPDDFEDCVVEGGDLCLSWCAWSELSYDLRVEYAEKVISKCKHFFICSNYNKVEDLEILFKYFTGIKEYDDELVQNVLYA